MEQNKRRKGKRQRIWEYMRRNRAFEISDIMKIFEVKLPALRAYIKGLLSEKYIKRIERREKFLNQRFVLINDIGLFAPVVGVKQ